MPIFSIFFVRGDCKDFHKNVPPHMHNDNVKSIWYSSRMCIVFVPLIFSSANGINIDFSYILCRVHYK